MKGSTTKSFGQLLAIATISVAAVSFAQAKDVPLTANLTNLQQQNSLEFNDATLVTWRKNVNLPAVPGGQAISIEALANPNSAIPDRTNSANLANNQNVVFTNNAIKVDFTGRTTLANTAIVIFATNTVAGADALVGDDRSTIPMVFKPFTETGLKASAAEQGAVTTGVYMPTLVTVTQGSGSCPLEGPYGAGPRGYGFCDFSTRFVTNINSSNSFENETDATKKGDAFRYASVINNRGIVADEAGGNSGPSGNLGRTGPAYLVLGVGTENALPQNYKATLVVLKKSI